MKTLKTLFLTLLVCAMLLSNIAVFASTDMATITITEEVVNADSGLRKLVFVGTTPVGGTAVSSGGAALSFDSEVVEAANASTGAAITSNTARNLKNAFTVGTHADYNFQMPSVAVAEDGTRVGVLADMYTSDIDADYPGVDATSGWTYLEFYYRIKDGKVADGDTFKIETKGSTIFNGLVASAGLTFGDYEYENADGAETATLVSFTWEGSEPVGKTQIDVSGVEIADVTKTYDGEAAVVAPANVPEGVKVDVAYEGGVAPVNARETAYTATVTLTPTDAENTELVNIPKDLTATITINKKAVTFTVADATKKADEADPAFTGSFAEGALVGDDTVEDFAIEYTLDGTTINATVTNDNYDVTVVPGTLTINAVTATQTAVEGVSELEINGKIYKDLYKVNATIKEGFVGKTILNYGVKFRAMKGEEKVAGGADAVFTPGTEMVLDDAGLTFSAAVIGVPDGITVVAIPFVEFK